MRLNRIEIAGFKSFPDRAELAFDAGVYVAYYGWYEIRLFNGGSPDDPVISAATDLQGRLADTLDTLGAPALAGIVVALLATAALTLTSRIPLTAHPSSHAMVRLSWTARPERIEQ